MNLGFSVSSIENCSLDINRGLAVLVGWDELRLRLDLRSLMMVLGIVKNQGCPASISIAGKFCQLGKLVLPLSELVLDHKSLFH